MTQMEAVSSIIADLAEIQDPAERAQAGLRVIARFREEHRGDLVAACTEAIGSVSEVTRRIDLTAQLYPYLPADTDDRGDLKSPEDSA